MAKIDKGKRNYNYSGEPKSYWDFAIQKAKKFIPKTQKESAFDKTKRFQRENRMIFLEAEMRRKRKRRNVF